MGLFNSKKGIKEDDKADASASLSAVKKVIKTGKEEKNSSAKAESMKELYKDNKGVGSKKSAEGEKSESKKDGNAYKVLIKPLITEKASVLGGENKYFFEVSKSSNKIEITKAIQDVYGVEPVNVNVMSVRGKNVRQGRVAGKRKDWKKAIVTLKKGESIKIYEGV